MAILVLDATPLIHLAKTSLHKYLEKLDDKFFTSSIVKEEALAGDYPEKYIIEKLLKKKIQVEKPKKNINEFGLHAGEASVISLAKQKNAILVADDKVARATAKAINVEVVHTSYFVFKALNKKIINPTQAEQLVKQLVESGWWCDAETLARIYEKIRDSKSL